MLTLMMRISSEAASFSNKSSWQLTEHGISLALLASSLSVLGFGSLLLVQAMVGGELKNISKDYLIFGEDMKIIPSSNHGQKRER